MLDVLLNTFKGLWFIFRWPVYLLFACAALYIFLLVGFVGFDFLFKKRRFIKGSHHFIPRKSFILALIDSIKQKKDDLFDSDPDFFRYQGLIIFTGRQGSGKTVSLVEQALRYRQEYPLSKLITNLCLAGEDDVLDHWSKLTDYKNGIYGVVCCMDELQNWFSSNQSRDFPPEMLQVITQNRKNRRVIFGTAQTFNRLSKPIREQTTEVRECHTFFGCFTIVIRKEPFLDVNGDVDKWKLRGFYAFAHTKELRESYDTYKVIDSLSKSGFQPQINLNGSSFIQQVFEGSSKKRNAR